MKPSKVQKFKDSGLTTNLALVLGCFMGSGTKPHANRATCKIMLDAYVALSEVSLSIR